MRSILITATALLALSCSSTFAAPANGPMELRVAQEQPPSTDAPASPMPEDEPEQDDELDYAPSQAEDYYPAQEEDDAPMQDDVEPSAVDDVNVAQPFW